MSAHRRRKLERRSRIVKLKPDAVAALRSLEDAFVAKFGRKPRPEDPVFFDPDSDVPRFYDPDRLTRRIVEAMRSAHMRPELIYAFEKTGMLVTVYNYDQWSQEDLAEYEAAVEEFKLQGGADES